ncbi:RUN domain-containing protein 1 [Bactrocera tryoni]|uniref:RUN domain-containing protein 1 n=1 Tax=Bactrocera tryoni TaxID=59916 RepID=UPI001A985775|nr:RUN domain-containing protein 1 [Bactrocera tryoni]
MKMNSIRCSEQMEEKFDKDFSSLLAKSNVADNKENGVCAIALVEVANKHTDVGDDTGDEGQQLDEDETIFLERRCNSQCSESNAADATRVEARTPNSEPATPSPTFGQTTLYAAHKTTAYECMMGSQLDGAEMEEDEAEEVEVKDSLGKSTLHDTSNSELQLFAQCKEANGIFNDDTLLTAEHFDHISPHPLSERWSPLGANYDDAMSPTSELLSPESELELLSSDSQDKQEMLRGDTNDLGRLRSMEEEQELLTTSLMALTSHFAHVQLRVRQIVEAPSHERDQLLKDLEEFAFRGIPEPIVPAAVGNTNADSSSHSQPDDEAVRQRQFELIEHLKSQLSELEKLAYESGAPVLPQHILLEKQKIIIDELKNKLNLQVDERDLPELTSEELKNHVDNAIGEFVGPLRMKEQLVAQLKTQITDLERFIAFLQCDTEDSKMKTLNGNEKPNEPYNSYAAKKKGEKVRKKLMSPQQEATEQDTLNTMHPNTSRNAAQQDSGETLNSKAHSLLDKASLLMQMFATTHFGAKADQFQKNAMKKTSKGNHWGDLRAQLEVDIQEVASLAATLSFDREKLANMKRALKNTSRNANTTVALSAQNGTVTVPPRARTQPANAATHRKDLKAYIVSSDSDDDTYDCYAWERNHCRKTHGARYKGGDSIITISKELTTAVRKNFSMTLLRLIQHGLRVETESATSSLIVPFMRCLNPSPVFAAEQGYRGRDTTSDTSFVSSAAFSSTYNANYTDNDCDDVNAGGFFGSGGSRPMHAWELILEYYYLKNGDEFNNTPARKLSQSFNLDIVDAQTVTAKQNFLSAVGMIIAMHRPYKRSYNAHFKAFVCAGLNCHQLVEWLNLIFSCNDLVDTYYTPNSYVARTGFRDSLRSIDALTKYDFDLPIDLAIRHFRNL